MQFRKTWLVSQAMLAAIIAITFTVPATAQNETGKRPINRKVFEERLSWYDSSTAMYQVQYPILRSLPPLNSGMPWDILGTYIYLDSLARFDVEQRTEKAIPTWYTLNDTLKGLVKYLYKAIDANPIIFTQYVHEIDLKRGRKYVASANAIIGEVFQAYLRALPNNSDRAAFWSMLVPDYVLRIRVESIDSMVQRPFPSPLGNYIFHVRATVLDTLKGHVMTACYVPPSTKRDEDHIASSILPCIGFDYVHYNYFRTDDIGLDHWMFPARDPEFSTQPDSNFMMRVGQEAIVFLKHQDRLIDSSFDYFTLALNPQASFNALPIIGGKVKDINHVWMSDTYTNYADWKEHFLSLRNRILNGTF